MATIAQAAKENVARWELEACQSGRSTVIPDDEVWSIECIVDQLFLHLVSVKMPATFNGARVRVRKYLEQARCMIKWIPIARPAPSFVVELMDLTPRLISELAASDKDLQSYILRQAVGRIFEEIDFERYHNGVARRMRVALT